MKFPSMEEMAKEVAEKALDEYVYQGKTIRQWVDILKDYDDKQTTLQRIVEQLEAAKDEDVIYYPSRISGKTLMAGFRIGIDKAINIIKEGL